MYAVYLRVLKLRVFQPVGSKGTLSILHSILGKLFWLAVITLILGLGSYLVSLYVHKQPAKLESSTRLIDARVDPNLTGDVARELFPKPKQIANHRLADSKSGTKSLYTFSASIPDSADRSIAAVDFKFQNSGQGSALLWKVGIEVAKAHVDPSPVLSFRYFASDDDPFESQTSEQKKTSQLQNTVQFWFGPPSARANILHIQVANTGWGPATCDVSLQNHHLEEFFTEEELRFRTPVSSGGTADLQLDFRKIKPERNRRLQSVIVGRTTILKMVEMAIRNRDAKRLREIQKNDSLAGDSAMLASVISRIEKRQKSNAAEESYLVEELIWRAVPVGAVNVSGSCLDEAGRSFSTHQTVEPLGTSLECSESLWLSAGVPAQACNTT